MIDETTRLFNQLRKVIDLPTYCSSIVLRLATDGPPTIETKCFIGGEESVTERFRLVAIEDDKAPDGSADSPVSGEDEQDSSDAS